MKNTKIGRHTLTERWHKFNKFLMLKAGVGDTVNDIKGRLAEVVRLIDKEPTKAKAEIENIHTAVSFVDGCVDLNGFAFCALIKEIDGEPCDDLSDEGMQKVYETVAKMRPSVIEGLIEGVKKKLTASWTRISQRCGSPAPTNKK